MEACSRCCCCCIHQCVNYTPGSSACMCVCVFDLAEAHCNWYAHESGPVLPGTDWSSFHSGRGHGHGNACCWLPFSQVSGTATQERRAEAARAARSASEQLREEKEGERRGGELQWQDWATAPNTAVFFSRFSPSPASHDPAGHPERTVALRRTISGTSHAATLRRVWKLINRHQEGTVERE